MGVNAQVRLRIDHPTMRAVVSGMTQEALMRGGRVTRERYRGNIRAAGRVDSGKMARQTRMRPLQGQPKMHPKIAIGTPVPYAKYQEFGTRAHGPVKANRLRFKPKGSSTFVFARWVRGVRPAYFARRALDHVRPSDFAA